MSEHEICPHILFMFSIAHNKSIPFCKHIKHYNALSKKQCVVKDYKDCVVYQARQKDEVINEISGVDITKTGKPNSTTGEKIIKKCNEMSQFLCAKNQAYGDSALRPTNIFSKLTPGQQLDVRIDDKINRVIHGKSYPGDNDVKDLCGYLILKLIQLDDEENK